MRFSGRSSTRLLHRSCANDTTTPQLRPLIQKRFQLFNRVRMALRRIIGQKWKSSPLLSLQTLRQSHSVKPAGRLESGHPSMQLMDPSPPPSGHHEICGEKDGDNEGGSKKIFSFNMAKLSDDLDSGISESSLLTRLAFDAAFDDGAPYSAFGSAELRTLASTLTQDWNGGLDVVRKIFARSSHW